MRTAPTRRVHSSLRRRLASQRPGRATAIASVIAIALAATGLDSRQTDAATATADPLAGATRPAAESPSAMAMARAELAGHR
jgi:hypothetical protein